jgi:uncharacterized membrane protein
MVEKYKQKKSEKNSELESVNEKVNVQSRKTAMIFEDPKVNIRVVLAVFWISHFLLWTFGDMVSLLQESTQPVANELLLFVAAPLAITQTFMIAISLIGKPKHARWLNISIAPVFMLFNIGYISVATQGWNYLLGMAYIMFNVLVIRYAWKWPRVED